MEVSVPLRGYGFEIIANEETPSAFNGFPSPCGDMVLKFRRGEIKAHETKMVSVPLRGYGFEIVDIAYRTQNDFIVSVPLRGYGFEISCKRVEHISR